MKKLFCCSLLWVILLLPSCYKIKSSNGGGQVNKVKARKVDVKDVALPEGYKVEVVTTGLTFPTGITFDESAVPYVVEAGYSRYFATSLLACALCYSVKMCRKETFCTYDILP